MKKISTSTMKIVIVLIFGLNSAFAQNFALPKLSYEYKALEPWIDAQTMEIHHSKHHQAYVNNLNKALVGSKFENKSLEDILLSVSRTSDVIRNNAGGHYNHTLFWEVLTAKKDSKLSTELETEIIKTFSSVDSLKKLLNQAASTRFGSGWAWLIVNSDKKLQVCSSSNQDSPLMDISAERGIPILGIDVWEHAYYLKYQNKRGDYLSAIWNVLNWEEVSKKYELALKNPMLQFFELDSWKAMKVFQKVMSEIFVPAENGDLDPVKANSSELMLAAINLKASNLPKSIDSQEMKVLIDDLVKHSNALHKMVKKKLKDPILKAKLFETNDSFRKIQLACQK